MRDFMFFKSLSADNTGEILIGRYSSFHGYLNKRVIWLMVHNRSPRIREKNQKRIVKWIDKGIKRGRYE